jgi:hypothetical protein
MGWDFSTPAAMAASAQDDRYEGDQDDSCELERPKPPKNQL